MLRENVHYLMTSSDGEDSDQAIKSTLNPHHDLQIPFQGCMALYRTLASGAKVPFVAFGTGEFDRLWQAWNSCVIDVLLTIPGTAQYNSDVSSLITLAISTGITHIDTAQYYQNEEYIGKALHNHFVTSKNPRSSLFITTKLWSPMKSNTTVKSVLTDELKKLQIDYVDLYLLHTPIGSEGRLAAIWKEFEEVKREGLAKDIGVSNFRVKDLEELFANEMKEVPAVNQVCVLTSS